MQWISQFGGARSRGNVVLLVTAIIWGSSFVAQRAGMAHMGPFAYNGLRCFLGAAVLLPVLWMLHGRRVRAGEAASDKRALWRGGALCGVVLFCASSFQQMGIVYETSGKAGFITALYILIVPLLAWLGGRRPPRRMALCVGLGLAGLYLLCATEGAGSLGVGDWLLLASAFCFAVHILVVARVAPRVNGIALAALQFTVCGVLSLPVMFLLEDPSWGALRAAAIPFLYSGVMACGAGYTLQIIGQRDTDPTVASLIMCLESVFAVFFGWLILSETVTPRELFGCGLMFIATVLAQLPIPGRRSGEVKRPARP